MHVQFENSYKKRAKYIFNFEIYTKKKSQNEKRKDIYFDFFACISLVHFFCILNLKIHTKKKQNFQIGKMYMQKRVENIISKKNSQKKKAEIQKKMGLKITF